MSYSEQTNTKFVCQRCTNCCRWPGFVRLGNEEISRISNYLKLSEFEFIQQYTRLRPQRTGLARINHKLRSETQREVLGYKAGDGFRCELYEYIL